MYVYIKGTTHTYSVVWRFCSAFIFVSYGEVVCVFSCFVVLLVREQTHIYSVCSFLFMNYTIWEVRSYILYNFMDFFLWSVMEYIQIYGRLLYISHATPVAFLENILRFIKWNVRFYVDFFSDVLILFFFVYTVCAALCVCVVGSVVPSFW